MSETSQPRTARQRHFPPRLRFSRPSTKSDLAQRRRRRTDQSTLTQLNWVTSSFEDGSEGSEDNASDFEEPQPKKRRKMHLRQDTDDGRKQATLTQIDWPYALYDREEEAEEEAEEDAEGEVKDDKVRSKDDEDGAASGSQPEEEPCGVENEHPDVDDEATRNCSLTPHDRRLAPRALSQDPAPRRASSQSPSPSPRFSSRHQKRFSPSPELGVERSSPDPTAYKRICKTPQKQHKPEVPSSQSPATTPLSTTASPLKRTPLQELHRNVWAQRDDSPTPKRTKPVPDSEETDDEEKENWALAIEDDEQQHGAKKQPSKPSPSKTTPRKTRNSYDNDGFALPNPPSRSRNSDPPSSSGPIQCTPESSHIQPSSSASTFKLPSAKHLARFSEITSSKLPSSSAAESADANTNTIRPSQASTVDITQHSPRSSPHGTCHSKLPSKTASPHHDPPPSEPASPDLSPSTSPTKATSPTKLLPSKTTSPSHHSQKSTTQESTTQSILSHPHALPELPPSPPPAFESQFHYSMFEQFTDEDVFARRAYGGGGSAGESQMEGFGSDDGGSNGEVFE